MRSFQFGKQRLASVLSDETRRVVGEQLTARVIAALAEADIAPLVVSSDPEVEAWARSHQVEVVDDPGLGLNGAADAGVEHARRNGKSWLVVHSDLPLVHAGHLRSLSEATSQRRAVIAPSSDGGTTAIGGFSEIKFSYGPASFHRHLAQLDDPMVITNLGLLHDLDSPNDLESARQHPYGAWLKRIY